MNRCPLRSCARPQVDDSQGQAGSQDSNVTDFKEWPDFNERETGFECHLANVAPVHAPAAGPDDSGVGGQRNDFVKA